MYLSVNKYFFNYYLTRLILKKITFTCQNGYEARYGYSVNLLISFLLTKFWFKVKVRMYKLKFRGQKVKTKIESTLICRVQSFCHQFHVKRGLVTPKF